MLVFEKRGKPEYPGKNLSEQSREPTNSTHVWRRVREMIPGHIYGRRVPSPLRQPCSLKGFVSKEGVVWWQRGRETRKFGIKQVDTMSKRLRSWLSSLTPSPGWWRRTNAQNVSYVIVLRETPEHFASNGFQMTAKNQYQSNYCNQLKQEQTARWTNQNSSNYL